MVKVKGRLRGHTGEHGSRINEVRQNGNKTERSGVEVVFVSREPNEVTDGIVYLMRS